MEQSPEDLIVVAIYLQFRVIYVIIQYVHA